MESPKLTHLNEKGESRMVDVSAKPVTLRQAVAEGYVTMQPQTLRAIVQNEMPKGEVLNTARIAGILGAKRTGDLIPMCHGLAVEQVEVTFELPVVSDSQKTVRIRIQAMAKITAKTGVEMEALTAVALAGLTIYDMCKAIDKQMTIEGIRLLSKSK
jgi:cyclic pyranopterin monophosphate synthase